MPFTKQHPFGCTDHNIIRSSGIADTPSLPGSIATQMAPCCYRDRDGRGVGCGRALQFQRRNGAIPTSDSGWKPLCLGLPGGLVVVRRAMPIGLRLLPRRQSCMPLRDECDTSDISKFATQRVDQCHAVFRRKLHVRVVDGDRRLRSQLHRHRWHPHREAGGQHRRKSVGLLPLGAQLRPLFGPCAVAREQGQFIVASAIVADSQFKTSDHGSE